MLVVWPGVTRFYGSCIRQSTFGSRSGGTACIHTSVAFLLRKLCPSFSTFLNPILKENNPATVMPSTYFVNILSLQVSQLCKGEVQVHQLKFHPQSVCTHCCTIMSEPPKETIGAICRREITVFAIKLRHGNYSSVNTTKEKLTLVLFLISSNIFSPQIYRLFLYFIIPQGGFVPPRKSPFFQVKEEGKSFPTFAA